ncbi:DUF3530 family protein [Marinomonas dokdonensis]|uniref:DUF3530 family protein n=1 Tax=Marinomonas dokdonensis TaxID=328224 RepID=UPI004055495B
MNKNMLNHYLISLILLFGVNASIGADDDSTQGAEEYSQPMPQAARIDALVQQLTNKQQSHQIQTLEAGDDSFLALYNKAITRDTIGCVILLPADNEHPDWPHTISPIRNQLPNYSWCTLSIELPDITNRAQAVTSEAPSDDNEDAAELILKDQDIINARIQASIDFAKSNNAQSIVLLGEKTGASYALNFLADNPNAAQALVMIDIKAPEEASEYLIAQRLINLNSPVLDYYSPLNMGSFNLWRKQAMNQNTNNSRYFPIESNNDTLNESNQQQLVQRVRGFLKQNTAQINQRKTLSAFSKGLFY